MFPSINKIGIEETFPKLSKDVSVNVKSYVGVFPKSLSIFGNLVNVHHGSNTVSTLCISLILQYIIVVYLPIDVYGPTITFIQRDEIVC